MPGRRWSDEEDARFRQRWMEGVRTSDMAVEFGVSGSAISKRAKYHGLPARSRRGSVMVPVSPSASKKRKYPPPCRRKGCTRIGAFKVSVTTKYIDKDKWDGHFCHKHLLACLAIELHVLRNADHLTIRRYSSNG
jgi:hypothetical protein